MKALPPQFAPIWRKAATDPEGKVEFLIEPMTHAVRLQISTRNVIVPDTKNIQSAYVDPTGSTLDMVKFQLKGLRGLKSHNSDEDFRLEFTHVMVVGKPVEILSDACFEQLPYQLISEISSACRMSAELTEEERDNVNFTVDSSQKIDPPVETAVPAEEK